MVSVGWTLVPGSVMSLPLTVTLPWRTSSAASRREQRPPLEMYLLRGRISVGALSRWMGAGFAGFVGFAWFAGFAGFVRAGPVGLAGMRARAGEGFGAAARGLCAGPVGAPARVGAGLAGLAGIGAGFPGAGLAGIGAGFPEASLAGIGAGFPGAGLRGIGTGCGVRAVRRSSKWRSMACWRSFFSAFFSWRKASLMALLRFLL